MIKTKIQSFINKNGLLLLIIVAFIFRMGFFVSLRPWDENVINKTILIDDATGYNRMALGILNEKSFDSLGSIRTPGYPLFLAICYLFFGETIWITLLLQIFISLLTLLFTYKITVECCSKRIALLTIFLLAFDYHQAGLAISLVTETLFIFLLVLAIYYLILGLKQKRGLFIILSGFFLGLATLTRPISFLFPVVTILFIICFFIIFNKDYTYIPKLKIIGKYVFWHLIIYLIVLSPWILRNYLIYQELKLTSISGLNLLFYNVTITEAERSGLTYTEARSYFMEEAYKSGCDTSEIHSFNNSRIYSKIAKNYIRNNFLLYCRSHLKGMVNLFYNVDRFEQLKTLSGFIKYKTIGFLIFFAIIYFFAVFGIILSIKKKYPDSILFLLIILYFDVITGVIGDPRFQVPIMPYIYIFCSIGISLLYDKVKWKVFNIN